MSMEIQRAIPVVSTPASPFYAAATAGSLPPPPPPPAASRCREPLNLWPGLHNSPVTNVLWEAKSSIFERLLDPPIDAPPQSQLLIRSPSHSRTVIHYNLSSDYMLRDQYRDPWNEVRVGKLLEDLDALAGTISVKHCSDDDSTTRPLLLVTASVDRMQLRKPVSVDIDLKMVGAVIWVGTSSIEIQLEVHQPAEGSDVSDTLALTANFIFVARDCKTGKAAPVNRLAPQTEQERLLFNQAEARNNLRKRKRADPKGFKDGDVGTLKCMLTQGRISCDMPALADRDTILLRDTRLENFLICQPQQRNMHGRIFGGFLMHRAFELAFATAYAFAGIMPCFLEVDHVDFLKPVDVGDFLRFRSCVLYAEREDSDSPLINIEVEAHVVRPELKSSEVTNTFNFTFSVRPEAKAMNKFGIRKVVPATEEEARRIMERMEAKASQLEGAVRLDA
uniref:HotDog ACOT-type domain-containing protein n=1 Tax=Kalanchoe fedtschenkoi TaxID=63787 RepID=A0A7N1A7P3_KALFE